MLNWSDLDETERATAQTVMAFLGGRLNRRDTIDWAINLSYKDFPQKLALHELLSRRSNEELSEPWLSAWRFIEESWSNPPSPERGNLDVYDIEHRIASGDRSYALIDAIVNLVSPTISIKSSSDARQKRRKIKSVNDLVHVELDSRDLIKIEDIGLLNIVDSEFLIQLSNALEVNINKSLNTAQRTGWSPGEGFWRLGFLYRVEYANQNNIDTDEFHRGIAPSVKLLRAVVHHLSEVSPSSALRIIEHWRLVEDPVHFRLWCSFSKYHHLVQSDLVEKVLLSLNEERFWDLTNYPEVAELRSHRFQDLSAEGKKSILKRIYKGPPKYFWMRRFTSEEAKERQHYWSIRELKRIRIAGSELPESANDWMARFNVFPNLISMNSIEEGFLSSHEATIVHPVSDSMYDTLQGNARLDALESALSTEHSHWNDDPSERASTWIRENANPKQVFSDLVASNSADKYPRVINCLGWHYSPEWANTQGASSDELSNIGENIISLLATMSASSLMEAIEGITFWVSSWRKIIIPSPQLLSLWRKLWPIAIEKTNSISKNDYEFSESNDQEPKDLDTLNNAAGRMIQLFLAACPNLSKNNAFLTSSNLVEMRQSIIDAEGKSGLIGRYRLLEGLGYFLHADKRWAKENLLPALYQNSHDAPMLWRAIARRTQFFDTLTEIGDIVVERISDKKFGRRTREALLSSLVIESLHSFLEERNPAISYSTIQQALRSVEDELRAHAAQNIQKFITHMSAKNQDDEEPPSAATIFRKAVKPFLARVWPLERSLTMPGVSAAFSDIPATSEDAFVEAVEAIGGFLTPFDCWSISVYGLRGTVNGVSQLQQTIDTREKALAFLKLLDLTVGHTEGAIIPIDLADALAHINAQAPGSSSTSEFRRLATAARTR